MMFSDDAREIEFLENVDRIALALERISGGGPMGAEGLLEGHGKHIADAVRATTYGEE